jgi:hypothetical protein
VENRARIDRQVARWRLAEMSELSRYVEVNYKDTVANIGEEKVKSALLYNSTAAFALIDNLKGIDYNFSGTSYQVNRAGIESLYPDFKNILEKDTWSSLVQNKLNDNHYVEDAFQRVMKTK